MEKLVRDKIQEFSEEAKDGRKFRVASRQEMGELLGFKLREEAHEAASEIQFASYDNTERLTEELADVLEVVDAILDRFAITKQSILVARNRKRAIKGAFSKGLVLDLQTNPEGIVRRT